MTVMHVCGLLGCLENGRPVSVRQVRYVRRVLDRNHSLRTKVAEQYGVSVKRLNEVLNKRQHIIKPKR